MKESYAEVIIDISHEKVDRPFQYRIPEELRDRVYPGVKVKVCFGRGNRVREGYVVGISEQPDYPPEKIKDLLMVDENGIAAEDRQMQIACWLKSQYGSTMITALRTVLPVKQKVKQLEKKRVVSQIELERAGEIIQQCEQKHQTAKARVLRALQEEAVLPYELLCQKLNVSAATLRSLENQGLLRIESETRYRNPVMPLAGQEKRVELREEQRRIVDAVVSDYRAGKPDRYLIHGITGSGKTEVYLGIIEKLVEMGKQAIVLIPEIALTYQTLLRFYKRFGDRVSVINSTLSAGEKYDQMMRAERGELDVMIGPRSALFTPFLKLGVIIIDEEHESSYKSEAMPKYHARETALQIAAMCGASVVMGSATPSVDAYYRAKKGELRLYQMSKRAAGSALPRVYTVDLREELKQGNRSVFSRRLKELMEQRLQKGEQTMLFLNRRGYAGFVSCRACGHVMKCPHCDVSLSEHRNGMLVCHYCGHEERKMQKCPVCGSKYLMGFKAGTEQIEEAIHREFPGARVLRMDADTTRKKGSYEKILSAFAEEEADILLGTQMIVKGHDFKSVTLVGVLAADLSLNQNDYRAGERTFQLLTQAAGRAGRGDKQGEVVIQTYQPEHYSIVHAAKQDYEGFYEEEILYREMLRYPPVEHMLAVLISSAEQEKGMELAQWLSKKAQEQEVRIVGPAEAAVGKISDMYRHLFYVRHEDYQMLVRCKDVLEKELRKMELRSQTVQFDFDPMSCY